MENILRLDRKLFLYLNNLGDEQWDWLWIAISNKWTAIPFYALLLYLLFRAFGWKHTVVTMLAIALLITISDQVANLFKDGVMRWRPCRDPELKDYIRFIAERCGKYGFYSAHASSALGLSAFLGRIFYPKYRILSLILIFWGFAVAYSRIYLGVHYPLDIVFGGSAGILYAFLIFKFHRFALCELNLKK